MYHSSVKSIFVEEQNDVPPICPKPRKLGSTTTLPEFLKSLNCNDNSQKNFDGRSGILNIVAEKTRDGRNSPSCYSGSPPGRTSNPLVQDVQFIQQMEHFSPLTRTNLSDKFGFTSVSPA
ncbi:uncharacterized protein [Solanum lycopersicum]|uniref:Uncharacterized protein n=2 Tax=Solanum TaxID=4107 RepID=M0ZW77_SOLTU|nr:uncharacterized protein LOC109119535 [Solanum lycopersicum]XP_049357688.1 uncharacterized protein LOC125822338 [Solanum verrucosum]KAH0700127.1 hypothetical protein KY284_014342 [Solanum tuberosum]